MSKHYGFWAVGTALGFLGTAIAPFGAAALVTPPAQVRARAEKRPAAPHKHSKVMDAALRRKFQSRISQTFFWIRTMSQRSIPVCELRAGSGLPIPKCCRDDLEQIADRLQIPLWVIERLNPTLRGVGLRHGHQVRLPAVSESIRRRCFLPVRYLPNPERVEEHRIAHKRKPRPVWAALVAKGH